MQQHGWTWKLSSEVSQTVRRKYHRLTFIGGILKKKKKDKMNLFADSQTLKNLWLPKETGWGRAGGLGWKCSKIRL